MKTYLYGAGATLLAVGLAATSATARPRHHHVDRGQAYYAPIYGQPVYPAYGYGYGDANASAAIVAEATARAQTEPGVTRELAPDSRQTATGGPVGGVPGFDGGL